MDVIQECVYQKQQVLSWFIHHRYAVGINRTTHYISQSRVETPSRRGEQFYCSFVANLLQYLYAKNYQNTVRFDKVIAKIEGCNFLPHRVVCGGVKTVISRKHGTQVRHAIRGWAHFGFGGSPAGITSKRGEDTPRRPGHM